MERVIDSRQRFANQNSTDLRIGQYMYGFKYDQSGKSEISSARKSCCSSMKCTLRFVGARLNEFQVRRRCAIAAHWCFQECAAWRRLLQMTI